jgi:hypothetical protein
MKPARLLGILFMVTVLVGMFAVIGFGLFGFGRVLRSAMHEDRGQSVQQAHTELETPYKNLAVEGCIDLEWVRDAKTSFDVSGDPSLVKRFQYEVKGDTLSFKLKSGFSFTNCDVKVVVHGPQPASFTIAGSGDSVLKGLQKGDFVVTVAGSGNVELGGEVASLVATVAGSGDVDASGLVTDSANVTISGSGNVDVDAKKDLAATIMGSGNVSYAGDPQIHKTVMGAGEVQKKD